MLSLLFLPFKLMWLSLKLIAYAVGALILLVSAFYLLQPDIKSLNKKNPETSAFMENYLKALSESGKEPQVDFRWVPFSQISPHLKKAVLVSEDDAFYQHNGFDWRQIKESLILNWQDKGFRRGGSTITQQLAKNLYLSPSKSIFRKIEESVLAYQIEKHLSKQRIFEIYLNVIEWGPGIYGAQAAAQHYFNVSAKNLSARQAAYLAAIIPNPKKYGAKKNNTRVQWKSNWILKRMGLAHQNTKDSGTPKDKVDEKIIVETPLPPEEPAEKPSYDDPVFLDY